MTSTTAPIFLMWPVYADSFWAELCPAHAIPTVTAIIKNTMLMIYRKITIALSVIVGSATAPKIVAIKTGNVHAAAAAP